MFSSCRDFKLQKDRDFVSFNPVMSEAQSSAAQAGIPHKCAGRMNGQHLSRQTLRKKEWDQRAFLSSSQPEPVHSLIQKGCLQQYRSAGTINNNVISFVCADHSQNSPSLKHMF